MVCALALASTVRLTIARPTTASILLLTTAITAPTTANINTAPYYSKLFLLLLLLLLLLRNGLMPGATTATLFGPAATTATNCFTTTLSWNLPDLPWPCSLGRLAALATLFVPPGAQNFQKGSPKGLSAVPTITAATTAILLALPPRFHGTYQVYLDRAVWAGWQLLLPRIALLPRCH